MRTLLFLFNLLFCVSFFAQSQGDLTGFSNEELDKIATDFYNNGDFKNALHHWTALLEKTENTSLDSLYISTLGNIGVLYEETGDLEQAEAHYQKSITLAEANFGKDHLVYVNALTNLAYLEDAKGNFKVAATHYKTVVEICRQGKGGTAVFLGDGLGNLASIYHTLGEYEAAETTYLASNKLLKKINGATSEKYATGLSNLASLYSKIGHHEQALVLDLESLRIRKKIWGNKHRYYALGLGTVAAKYVRVGKLEEAEPLMLEAMAIERNIYGEEHTRYAGSLSNLGVLYSQKKEYGKAIRVNRETADLVKKLLGEQHPAYGRSLNNLAIDYQHLKDYDNAAKYFLEASEINKAGLGEMHTSYAKSLHNLATAYQFKGNYAAAESIFLEAIAIYKANYGITHKSYLNALNNLGSLYYTKADFEKATAVLNQAIYANCKTKTIDLEELNVRGAIAIDLLEQNAMNFFVNEEMIKSLDKCYVLCNKQFEHSQDKSYLQTAYKAIQIAMKINEVERNNFSGEQNKLRTLETMTNLAFKAIFCSKKMATVFEKDKPNNKYLQEALRYAEQNKSILLSDAIRGSRAKILGDLPQAIALEELSLKQRKDKLQKKWALAQTDAQRSQISVKQNELNLEIDGFVKTLKNKYPRYHALKYQNIMAKATEIQGLLDEKTLLLEYFVANEITYLFAISKSEVELFPIEISMEDLNQEIKSLRHALSDYQFILKNKDKAYDNYIQSAYWCYQNLLAKALDKKAVEHLIIIADGELGHLPFEAFLTSPGKAQNINYTQLDYLVNHYNVSYNYSATLWKANKEGGLVSSNNQMLAYAASYPKSDSSILDLRGLNDFELRNQLQPLPAAQLEIQSLEEQFQGRFLYQAKGKPVAMGENWFKATAQDYGVIHLAMHGILDARVPMLSSLAFTENKDSLEDNFLQAYEISQLNLKANLVVLSACETGYGKFRQGEGVISLARSFMYAGVPSLVVSLWQVNDNSTSRIMQSFYDYLSNGLTKDAALRQAKLDYIEIAKGASAHPAFWSPFIQLGDNRPIEIAKQGNLYGYLLMGVGLMLLAGVLWKLSARRRES